MGEDFWSGDYPYISYGKKIERLSEDFRGLGVQIENIREENERLKKELQELREKIEEKTGQTEFLAQYIELGVPDEEPGKEEADGI